MTKNKYKTKKENLPRKISLLNRLRWVLKNNPKHEMNKREFQLDLKRREIKAMENGLKKHVDKLHSHTIRLAGLQRHIFTNHEQTLKEIEELKEFKKEKRDVEEVLKSLHHLLGHVPDEIADEFSKTKDFKTFQKVMGKHFKDYHIR